MDIDPRLDHDVRWAEAPGGKPVLVGYPDGGGVPTAGYGHTGPDVLIGRTYTAQQCEDWLVADLTRFSLRAQTLPEWTALDTPCRQNAIIECIFNLGDSHWYSEFPATRRSILAQSWQAAHDNLLNSPLWIKEVGIGRVTRLANYLLTGEYPS
jgi:GH24 family phage-related lysozyme (muramidase)